MVEWRKALKNLIRSDVEVGEESTLLMDYVHNKESDRGCVLICGAMAENGLQTIIETRLTLQALKNPDELFDYEGPLGTFSRKIKMAYGFGLIADDIRRDLDRIKDIRNAFAHSRRPISFATPAVQIGCGGFNTPIHKEFSVPPEDLARLQYTTACTTILQVATHAMTKTQKIKRRHWQPISYADTLPLLEKLKRQAQRQRRANLRSAGDKKAR